MATTILNTVDPQGPCKDRLVYALRKPWLANSNGDHVCCNKSITPQLAEISDHSGMTFFAPVWICPRCSRVSMQ